MDHREVGIIDLRAARPSVTALRLAAIRALAAAHRRSATDNLNDFRRVLARIVDIADGE
jgi:hypothetical protein